MSKKEEFVNNIEVNNIEVNNKEINSMANEILISKYLSILLYYKKFLIITTLSVGLISGLLLFFVIKPVFYSTATVKASGRMSGGLSGLLSTSGLSDISGLDDLSGGSSTKELALYTQILSSRRCIEETILKFNLMEVYDQKYMQNAIKNFREDIMEINKDNKSGTMEIGVFDYSPERAKEIAVFLIAQLNKINIELNVQNAKINREFIEQRYNLIRKELTQAEDSLKTYQEIYGLAPDVVAKAVLQSEVQTEVELKSEEIKLDILKKIYSPDQSEIKLQEEKINAIRQQLSDINSSDKGNEILSLKNSPEKIIGFLRLQRNVEIQNKLLTFILPIYEQAKIEEKKEMPSVLVIDYPNVPELKKKPKRIISIILSMIITFVLLSTCLIIYETILKSIFISLRKKNE